MTKTCETCKHWYGLDCNNKDPNYYICCITEPITDVVVYRNWEKKDD